MTAIQVRIRDAIYAKIGIDQPNYIITDFDIEKTYYPQETLEDLGARPSIKVVATGFQSDRDRSLRDTNRILLTVPVQVALQMRVKPTDTAQIDRLVELVEQIQASCEDDELVVAHNYTWFMTNVLKDENGVIFSYERLSQQGIFQAISIPTYQYVKDA